MPRSVIDASQATIANRDPIANDDYSAGFDFGSEWINDSVTPMRFWKCTDATIGDAKWQLQATPYQLATVSDNNAGGFNATTMNNVALYNLITNINNRANDSNPVFFDPSGNDYIEETSTSYSVRADIIYRGTDIWTPNTLIIMIARSKTDGSGDIRIWDYNNAQSICERNFTAYDKTILEFTLTSGEIALFPNATVALEMQLKATSCKVYLYAAGLYTI